MATITLIVSGYEAELDIPDDDQVADADRYAVMLRIANTRFQAIAVDIDLSEDTRANQLAATSAMLRAIVQARDAALPVLTLRRQ